MKKLFHLSMILLLVMFVGVAQAAVTVQEDGTTEGTVEYINYSTEMDVSVSGNTATVTKDTANDVTFQTSLLAVGRVSAVLQLSSSSTVITSTSVPYVLIRKNVGAGSAGKDTVDGGTRLADATPGQVMSILIASCGSGSSWVLTPNTSTGFTAITFDAVTENATLLYVNDTIGWIIVNTNATITLSTNFATGEEPGP